MAKNEEMQPQGPHPMVTELLKKIEGKWSMKGHLIGSDEENIIGTTEFRGLHDHFVQQDMDMNFAGQAQIKCREIIGYNPEEKGLTSFVFTNGSPVPLPYKWALKGNKLFISVKYGPLDSSFEGEFSEDGNSFSGGWRPNPGADKTINVPYDIGGKRLED